MTSVQFTERAERGVQTRVAVGRRRDRSLCEGQAPHQPTPTPVRPTFARRLQQ
ncbi:hypothetical protein RKD23_007551 [Streptomyces sp. SAI-170]|uniref:hypothetical protein n=1 Tax=Streptomyces sp. SAI-170 TaxID=3377729 RepID=UPI003C7A54F7